LLRGNVPPDLALFTGEGTLSGRCGLVVKRAAGVGYAMKRDMDLIRKMALAVEDAPTGYAPDDLGIEGYTDEQIAYHAHLMVQARLADGIDTTYLGSSGPSAQLTSLTWDGHEFAADARDETTWKKAITIVQEKGGAVSLDVIKALLSHLVKAGLGLVV